MSRRGRWFLVATLGALCCLSGSVAHAAVGPVYALDIARSTPPSRVIKLDPTTFNQTPLTLTAGVPAPELPMVQPVSIDVDQATLTQGTLLVAVSDGYVGKYRFTPSDPVPGLTTCNGGCGALLRIDPSNTGAATTTVVSGPPTEGTDNYWENPYGVLSRPVEGDILVTDNSTTRVISVNPANGNQTVFSKLADGTTPDPGGVNSPMRAPWGIARDPTNGDILVVSTGVGPDASQGCDSGNNFCRFDENAFKYNGMEVPGANSPDCQGNRGYVIRLSSLGVMKQVYCSPNFKRPRDITVDGNGTIFVTDPMAVKINPNLNDQAAVGYGVLFEIPHGSSAVEPVSAGSLFAAPSGLDINPGGSRLLVSDETLNQPSAGCPDGCGGLLTVNPNGGQQSVVSSRTVPPSSNNYVDPIDVTVDRGTGSTPALTLNTIPAFLDPLDVQPNNPVQARPERAAITSQGRITVLPLVPLRDGTTVTVTCLDPVCKGQSAPPVHVPAGAIDFPLSIPAFEYTVLRCKRGLKLRRTYCVPKKKRKKRHKAKKRDASSAFHKCHHHPCPIGHKASDQPALVAIRVTSPDLPGGRSVDVTLTGSKPVVDSSVCFDSQSTQLFPCPGG